MRWTLIHVLFTAIIAETALMGYIVYRVLTGVSNG